MKFEFVNYEVKKNNNLSEYFVDGLNAKAQPCFCWACVYQP